MWESRLGVHAVLRGWQGLQPAIDPHFCQFTMHRYVDVEEEETTMIAMTLHDLKAAREGACTC